MAGWPRGSEALAGWVARFLGRWAGPAPSGEGFLTCQYQLALGREVQPILASDVLDDDLAVPLQQRCAGDAPRWLDVRGDHSRVLGFGRGNDPFLMLHVNENTSHLQCCQHRPRGRYLLPFSHSSKVPGAPSTTPSTSRP
jgi:hypothetical protein